MAKNLRFSIFIPLCSLLPKDFYGLTTTTCTTYIITFPFRRERDNADAERAQHIKQIHDLQEHIQEKERQFVELQEQVSLLFFCSVNMFICSTFSYQIFWSTCIIIVLVVLL